MIHQTTSSILMVRPANFGFNPETAANNFYQQKDDRSADELNQLAIGEFDAFVSLLGGKGVEVIVIEDTKEPVKTDAIFPNNWFSTHEDGKVILYPMFSPIRRLERRKDLIESLIAKGFMVNEIIDLTFFEEDNQYLEGTGSLILDRINQLAYACLSERTHEIPLDYFGRILGYETVKFDAVQKIDGKITPIYHTNVMMHLGRHLAVICLDSIPSATERKILQDKLEQGGKKIIPISSHQKFNFAGNMLEVQNVNGQPFTVVSQTALKSLKKGQLQTLEKYTEVISPAIPTIEKLGGGSVRCMMAEIFLPRS
ncbi:citrulline utilization hydrolase CtlX [Pararhodonellum marinum]|uniref:citrulline utilization hydrolase CtlX n=1 Tax=Pararhodonellum marinum TaxID=2755358 RepID=UPI00188E3F3C|nr:arginine deiminase-related protein [Pararhodonellum marinum]